MRSSSIVCMLIAALFIGSLLPSSRTPVHAAPAIAPALSVVGAHAALFEKTRFLFDMGTGFYAFYHWVWTPYQNHQFSQGVPGRFAAMGKAAVALFFAYHQMVAAYKIANKSNNKALRLLAAPLNKLMNHMNTEGTNLKKGQYSSSDITTLNSETNNFGYYAHGNGISISQIPYVIPKIQNCRTLSCV